MKHLFGAFLLALVISLMTGPVAWSYPIQYTIDGNVIQGPGINDTAGFLADLGITVGSHVSYTFVIDLDAKGTIMLSDGTISELADTSFYAHYLSGSTITPGNYMSSYNGISENNYGVNNWLTSTSSERSINVSNGNNYLTIIGMLQQPDSTGEWPIGSPIAFGAAALSNTIFDEFGNSSSFYFDAQIASAEIVPVPEPSTFALLGTGLTGIFILGKRFRKRPHIG